jgi:hypothetical protein
VKARSLSACIASLKTDTNLFDGSNVGCLFFFFLGLAPRNFQGGTGRASLRRLRRPAFPHRYCTRTLLFGVGIVQKHSFALTRQAQPSKHRAPVKRHTVVLPPPPPLHLVHKRPSRLGDSKSFPESSSYHTYRMPYSHYHMPALAASRELSTIVVRPIMAFHAFVNDAAEAGQDPDITKPWTGIWLRHSCPPLWRLTLVSVSSRPHGTL